MKKIQSQLKTNPKMIEKVEPTPTEPIPSNESSATKPNKRGLGAMTEEDVSPPNPNANEGIENTKNGGNNPPKPPKGEDLSAWLKEDAWPTPNWLKPQAEALDKENNGFAAYFKKKWRKKDKDFGEYVKNKLRWQYMRLENDFRTALNNFYDSKYFDRVIARRIISFLNMAREALDSKNCDSLDVSNLLNMADQYMVWLYPPHVAQAQAKAMSDELQKNKHPLGELLKADLALDTYSNSGLDKVRAALDKIKDTLNQENQSKQIDDGLQIERLEMLVRWGRWILLILILGVPALFNKGISDEMKAIGKNAQDITTGAKDIQTMAANLKDSVGTGIMTKAQEINAKAQELASKTGDKAQDVHVFKETALFDHFHGTQPWAVMIIIALIGAVGAFLSGLMRVRDSSTTITSYKKSIIQFHLRPIVGAIFAVILTTLLSWNLIAGLTVSSVGVYILSAFLCGFSESYFLNILELKGKGDIKEVGDKAGVSVPSSVPISSESTDKA